MATYGLSLPAKAGSSFDDADLGRIVQTVLAAAGNLQGAAKDDLISSTYKMVASYAKSHPDSKLAKNLLETAHAHAAGREYPAID